MRQRNLKVLFVSHYQREKNDQNSNKQVHDNWIHKKRLNFRVGLAWKEQALLGTMELVRGLEV